MVIWVKQEATDSGCDQRAEIEKVVGQRLYVTLLGSGAKAIVMANEVCGIELGGNNDLTLLFDIKRISGTKVCTN